MFDFGGGYTELMVIALVAIIVIGPKDLPRVLRALGRMTTKMRSMAREFQGHMDAAMREAGLDEVKKDLQSIKNPMATVKSEVAAEFKKQDDDFKKYFGTTNDAAKPAANSETPAVPPPAPAATAEPASDVKSAS